MINETVAEEKAFHTLKVLMHEIDESNFKQMIESAVVQLKNDPTTQAFGEYFETNYKSKCEQWANCFRLRSGVNTNMYLEAFHHILKYKFLKGKKKQTIG